jgi:hypothetical protein
MDTDQETGDPMREADPPIPNANLEVRSVHGMMTTPTGLEILGDSKSTTKTRLKTTIAALEYPTKT